MAQDHGPQIKNDRQYEALLSEGASKEKAARIANSPNASQHGGEAETYEDRSVDELYALAQERDITGRSRMNKRQLIKALRH